MTYPIFVPSDNHALMMKYEKLHGGTCGPAAIAVLEHITVQEVLNKWKGIGQSAFRGYSPIADMKETLTAFGYKYKSIRAHKAKEFPTPKTDIAILRIQWLKPDGTEYYWAAAGSHTHYLLMKKIDGAWWVFCNGQLWFESDSTFAKNYFSGRGYLSSYIELTKEVKDPDWPAGSLFDDVQGG